MSKKPFTRTIRLLLIPAIILFILSSCQQAKKETEYTGLEYELLKKKLSMGWNTWNNNSVMSHVLLPDKLALNLYAYDKKTGRLLKEAFIGNKVPNTEKAVPGNHTYDGTYTDLTVTFEDLSFRIQTSASGPDISIWITPLEGKSNDGFIILSPSLIWNSEGEIWDKKDYLLIKSSEREIKVFSDNQKGEEIPGLETIHWSFPLNENVILTTIENRTDADIENIIQTAATNFNNYKLEYGENRDIYEAIQTVMAWNTIYDPTKDRVITPVSRIWDYGWKGYVLFCWDNYFVSYMFSLDNKKLAFANAIEITHEITESGFVPNFAATNDLKSRDRSQPPVGSMMVREIYRHYPEKWFLQEVYDDLLIWNRWWPENRDTEGLLCWGSNPYTPLFDDRREKVQNVMQGAKFESGLDNSPMFDDATFDTITHQMRLASAGLTGLYIADCNALAEIADVLDKKNDASELRKRAEKYSKNIQQLWSEEDGIFLNLHTDSKKLSKRISPTNFYPLIGKAATQEQAKRMIIEHFYNPDEFWGEWIIPSIARNDPAYPDNSYWRGRIWAPMNFLVYLGLRNYDLPDARHDLAEKSASLLLKSWKEDRYIHENYNAETGEGDDVRNSDNFYHWGALLGIVYLIEDGIIQAPEQPLKELGE